MAEYPRPANGWGQAAANNTNGFGQGAGNSTNGWGTIHALTPPNPATDFVGADPTYTLKFNQDDTTPQFAQTVAFTPSIGFSVSFNSDWVADTLDVYMGNDGPTSANGIFYIKQTGAGVTQLWIRDSASLQKITIPGLTTGKKLTLTYSSATTWDVYVDDVIELTATVVGFTPLSKSLVFGSYQNSTPPSFGANMEMWNLSINGEVWLFDEQTGSTATGDSSTVLYLWENAAAGGTFADMWGVLSALFFFSFNVGNYALSNTKVAYNEDFNSRRIILNSDNNNITSNNVINNDGFIVDSKKIGAFADNVSPFFLDRNIGGGTHGFAGKIFTVVGHGKTIVDDIYSVWANGGNEIVIWNISGNDLYIAERGISSGVIAAGVWTHVSGAVNTASITLGATSTSKDIVPSIKLNYKKVFIDGVEEDINTSNYYNVNSNARLEEQYDISTETDLKEYLISLQGTGVLAETGGGDSVCRITNNYVVDDSYFITGKMSFEVLKNIPAFDHTKFLQQVTLIGGGDYWYIPKSSSITTADGTFNLSNLTPYQALTETMKFKSFNYEFPTSPPDRQLMILNNNDTVYVHGFLPILDGALGSRVNMVNESMQISSVDQKFYMRGQTSDKVGSSLTVGEKFDVYSYRGIIPQQSGRTASYFVHNYETGKGYMYADWHTLPTTDSITIPSKYQGKTFTVVEKTANVTMVDGTLGSSLSVPVANTHNYGFLTIEISA